MRDIKKVGWLVLLLVIIFSCDRGEKGVSLRPGMLVSDTVVGHYDTAFVRLIVRGIEGVGRVTLRYDVAAVRLVYLTRDAEGKVVPASGLLVVPECTGSFPLLSVQHGTVARRENVPSQDPLLNEGVVSLITGSEGYVTLIPDYLGLGVSREMHPYLMRDVLSGNVTDMIMAVLEYIRGRGLTIDGTLYLAGYSEGGYVTMAVHRAMELYGAPGGLEVMASAPMAGSYDLKLTVDTILSYGVYRSPAFIAYTLCAYDRFYHWNRLAAIFRAPYAAMIPGLFDGAHTIGEINNRLPVQIDSLLRGDFTAAYEAGGTPWLTEVLQANSLLDWVPAAPVRLYHGDRDMTVPYWNAVKAKEELLRLGGKEVTLVTIEGGNHDSSVTPSFIGAVHWFDSLRNAR